MALNAKFDKMFSEIGLTYICNHNSFKMKTLNQYNLKERKKTLYMNTYNTMA